MERETGASLLWQQVAVGLVLLVSATCSDERADGLTADGAPEASEHEVEAAWTAPGPFTSLAQWGRP